MRKIIPIVLGAMFLSASAEAGGFQINLQGLRQTAMAGSGTAMPWDVSTMFYNPAGLSLLQDLEVNAGLYAVNANVRYAAPGTGYYYADAVRHYSTPFHFYFGGKTNPDSRIGFGIGVYTPFGSRLDWGEKWRGRYIVQNIALQSIYFQPSISYQINDIVSIGAGFVYGIGKVDIEKAIPLQDASGDGKATLNGDASGIGVNLGIHLKPDENIYLGLNYRSGLNMRVEKGLAKFDVPKSLAANFPTTNFTTELNLPDIFTLGIAGKVTPDITLQGDLIYSNWKKYERLAFDFEQNTEALLDTDDPRHYKSTFAIRVGGNFKVGQFVDLMAGGFYDPTPTQDTLLSPDAIDGNRVGFSGGMAYTPIDKVTAYIVFSYTSIAPRSASYAPANFSGSYQIKSFTPGVGFTYRF